MKMRSKTYSKSENKNKIESKDLVSKEIGHLRSI